MTIGPGNARAADVSLRPNANDGHDPVIGISLPLLVLLRAISSATSALSAPSIAITKWINTTTSAAQRGRRKTRVTYLRLADRGEAKIDEIRARPEAAYALATVRQVTNRADDAVQNITDEVEESAEETLARASIAIRSIAQRPIRSLTGWIRSTLGHTTDQLRHQRRADPDAETERGARATHPRANPGTPR
jgi:hypothetical protein